MVLKGRKIANLKMFRRYFDLPEIILNRKAFLRDFSPQKILYDTEDERRLYEFVEKCESLSKLLVEQRGDVLLVTCVDAEQNEFSAELKHQDTEEALQAAGIDFCRRNPTVAAMAFALCDLAYVPCGRDILGSLESCAGRQTPEVEDIRQAEEVLKTAEGFAFGNHVEESSFMLWSPETVREGRITTKKLVRKSYSEYVNSVELIVFDRAGKRVEGAGAALEHEIYANFIDGYFLEFLPSESRSGTFRISKEFRMDGHMVLSREKNGNKLEPFGDESGEFERMSCFAATEDNGLVGISDGHLISCTGLINLPDMRGTVPVYVCERNGLYLILAEDGRTYANFLFEYDGICMIRMDQKGFAYALDKEGRLKTNNQNVKKKLESQENVVYLWCDGGAEKLRLRYEDGSEREISL